MDQLGNENRKLRWNVYRRKGDSQESYNREIIGRCSEPIHVPATYAAP